MDEVDSSIADVTRGYTKAALFDLLIGHRVPCAPVRTLQEVVNDPHLHARGALRWVDHPEYGRIVLPTSPLRFTDEEPVAYQPSSPLGHDTLSILADRLGLSVQQMDQLQAQGAL